MSRGNPAPVPRGPSWTTARSAMLQRLHRAGRSDPEIAAQLRISLRAVIGKRYRLGLRANTRPPPIGMAELEAIDGGQGQ